MQWHTPKWWSKHTGVAWLLWPLSTVYYAIFLVAYYWQKQRRFQVAVPVVCVGNVTVGGVGKTPTVIALARWYQAQGLQVHCISKGYGRSSRQVLQVDPLQHDARLVGDEPLLLAKVAPTWVGHDRCVAIALAIKAGAEVLVLDDGLQDASLCPDVAVLVINGTSALGNGLLFPAGPLREPLERVLKRVDDVVWIDGGTDCALYSEVSKEKPVYQAYLSPTNISSLIAPKYIAFAGIAYPERFFSTLRTHGIALIETIPFPDHYRYAERDITHLQARAEGQKAALVTTEKDWVRLPSRLRHNIATLQVELLWKTPLAERLANPLSA